MSARIGPLDPAVLERAARALRARGASTGAFWAFDLDSFAARARRLTAAFAPLRARVAYALKANGLVAVAKAARAAGLDVDAGSRGELELARRAGFTAGDVTQSGNGRTDAEIAEAASFGVSCLSVDQPDELDRLERAAAAGAHAPLRVALRVNPGILAGGHAHIVTAARHSKFGLSAEEALELWAARARWPNLRVDGVHLHLGSQVAEAAPLVEAARVALELSRRSAARGARLTLVNLGGGFAVDYAGGEDPLDLEAHARTIATLPGAEAMEWRFEPGRWLVAPAGVLVAEVLWDRVRRDGDDARRFVVLAAGMNDLLRPALYGARHRIVPLRESASPVVPADVVGPVCESGDTFARDVPLPPLARGDLVAILDAGAYGSVMSSNYNGRPRHAEVVVRDGVPRLARAAETRDDLFAREQDEALD